MVKIKIYVGLVFFASEVFIANSAVAKSAHNAIPTSSAPAKSGGEFNADEISLLLQACKGIGGSVALNDNEFVCRKNSYSQAGASIAQPTTPGGIVATVSQKNGKYTGASLADLSNANSSVDITKVHTIAEVVPLIKKGSTTRDHNVAALKEPGSSSYDSNGSETAVFREEVAFWKTGGIGQLFTKRGPVQKVLVVTFTNGVVSYFSVQDRR